MFYVYVYKDPRPTKNLQVVYVGKGYGDRMYAHWKKRVHNNRGFGAFLALLRRNDLEPVIEKVADYEDEAEAFAEEMRLISLYGRRDIKTGTLFNLTGGGEGVVGALRTDEWKSNISEAHLSPEKAKENSARMKALWTTPEYRDRVVTKIRAAMQDPEVHARREAAKAQFNQTPEFRETMRNVAAANWADKEYAAKVAEGQKKVQGTPEARAMKSKNSAAGWADEEVRQKRQEGIKKARSSAESRAKTVAQAKAMWSDPEYVAKQVAFNKEMANRPEVKAAKSAASKARWADPEWKAKMMAARAAKKLAAAQANCHNALTGVSGVADGPGRRHADSSTPTCM
jgi:hypothetical protein